MQSYAANTTKLDNLDAAGYATRATAPTGVLRQANVTIDGRTPTWESPAAMLSLLCHFKEIRSAAQWQSLARIPDRCGKPRPLVILHSQGVAPVAVPPAPAGSVLIAQVYGLQIHGAERIDTLFTRAAERRLVINGLGIRVVPDTVADGLIFDVPPYADYAPPFAFNLGVRTMRSRDQWVLRPVHRGLSRRSRSSPSRSMRRRVRRAVWRSHLAGRCATPRGSGRELGARSGARQLGAHARRQPLLRARDRQDPRGRCAWRRPRRGRRYG